MAETVARRGGITVIPQDIPLPVVADVVRWVKGRHLVFDTPIELRPHPDRRRGAVADPQARPPGRGGRRRRAGRVGVVSEGDCAEVDRFAQVGSVMSTRAGDSVRRRRPAASVFDATRAAPASARRGRAAAGDARGRPHPAGRAARDALHAGASTPAGRLRVAAAVGVNGDVADEGRAPCSTPGSTASSSTRRTATRTGCSRRCAPCARSTRRSRSSPATSSPPQGTRALIEAGADIVKVGVGPGAMCTTRMMTGVGRPQFSAVLECAAAARELGKHVWADGGVRHPRDVALALAAGARSVMIGSWFAGTHESPGRPHARRRRAALQGVLRHGLGARRGQPHRRASRRTTGHARALYEEGISSSRMYLDPQRPGVEDLIDQICSGVRSSCTYAGASRPRRAPRAGGRRGAVGGRVPRGTAARAVVVTEMATSS